MTTLTPQQAWDALFQGNQRFVFGEASHPSQDIDTRIELIRGQTPNSVIFGCSDSRVAAEIIFDQGLGDVFVIRTAGHVIDSSVLGSVEYALEVLRVPLIIILGHDNCGAVTETIEALRSGHVPGGYLRDIIERVTPSILAAQRDHLENIDDIEGQHVKETARLLLQRSRVVVDKVSSGLCAIVGATYQLDDGQVEVQCATDNLVLDTRDGEISNLSL